MQRVLVASYGDREQQEQNRKPVDRREAARIEAAFRARRAAEGRRELPTPPRTSNLPFWDAKYHGSPISGHAASPPKQVKAVKVEIRPGVFHTVELVVPGGASPRATADARDTQLGQPPAAAAVPAGRARPSSAPLSRSGNAVQPGAVGARQQSARPGPAAAAAAAKESILSPGSSPRPGQQQRTAWQQQQLQQPVQRPCELDTLHLAPLIAGIEDRMRAALQSAARMHVPERTVLLRALGKVLGKKDISLGPRDSLDTAQFSSAWSSLGLDLAPSHVAALFNKYGHDARGRLPAMVFVEALLYGAPRQLMLENDWVQRGAYVAGQPATHTGKIQYPECKKGVWPPSNWHPRVAERSAQLPDIRLHLEFVYGYDGFQATSPNIFYTATGEVVYFAAAVGIVYNKASHTQRLFLGHDDDILCLAIHPDRTTVATGQVGKDPCVIVWDTNTLQPLQKLHQGYGNRGVQTACFSSSGTKLAVVCTDNSHTLYVWDWPRKQLLLERKTMPGTPPSTYGVVWSPFEQDRIVTYGQNYIKFFELLRPGAAQGAGSSQAVAAQGSGSGAWECKQDAGVFTISKTYTIFSACFLPSGVVLTGNGAGVISSWRGCKLVRETPGHAPGPLQRRPDGVQSYGGVRCLVLQAGHATLLSGGADGYVIKWDVSKGDVGAALQRIPMLRPDQMGVVAPPAIRGLDCLPGSDMMVAGTAACDVWEVDETPEVLVHGQQGDLYGLAMNPAYPHVFATACESDTVMVWSAATQKPLRIIQLSGNGDMARSCAFSPDGEHLAVGMWSGGLKVLEFYPSLAQVYWGKLFNESVDELKYSPCGRYLAAGSHDQNLDVYDVKAGYKRVCRCVGHSSTITHLDWSADSSVIQSNDQAYEILYFDPHTGKQVKSNQRDTPWATWTCVLGFDVMGIWPPDSDGTDVNSVDRSPSGKYLLTADDRGKVSLFNHPVVVHQAPALRYPGHSSHVMNVRWATDESYAISVGGRDRCIFQWRIVESVTPPDHFYGRQPLAPVDKSGLVYRLPEAGATAPGAAAGAGAQPLAGAAQPAVVLRGEGAAAGKAPLGGGGYGLRQ